MKVFLAHLFQDQLANELAVRLERNGVDVFMAERHVSVSNTITDKLRDAIQTCDFFMALITAEGARSTTVREEVAVANAFKKRILLIVEKGYEQSLTGFSYGKDFLSFDPYNSELFHQQLNEILRTEIKKTETSKAKQEFFTGLIAGILVWALLSDES